MISILIYLEQKVMVSFFRSFYDGNHGLIGTVSESEIHFIKTAQTKPTHTLNPYTLQNRYVSDKAIMEHRKYQVKVVFRSPIAPNLTDFRNRICQEIFIFVIFEETGFLTC